ncbi:uncharacterized protein GGS22DRAFT_154102 [Annulohypoxylon maeteangense]|uniref:uncharacterized protein n=1 Tax=Annulohypoxylon maeteangense TaxID=1927788 RepID=UPI0020075434|nr:uncharacterized protein GGS22DRAFT_154102 [Annulohypoxylon maeteangense]KAI0887720.1 hypothetical protein GGS22DRAFT_154102 [Annulohypoxylon maeteangense]
MSDLGIGTARHTNGSLGALTDDSENDWVSDTGDEENAVGDLETGLQCQERRVRLQIYRLRLKWGEMQMPPPFYEQCEELEGSVDYLSFGTERQWLGEPKEGRLYVILQ